MRIQNPQYIYLNNPLLLSGSRSIIMILHGLPHKILGKSEIALDE